MVILTEGCKVPADCIIVDQSADLEVRQPMRSNQENPVDVDDSDAEDAVPEAVVMKSEEKDPFLWADTYILEGQAKAVVVCVGDHSSRPKYERKLNVRKTPLEEKMNNIYKSVLFMSTIAILVIVGTGIVLQCIYFGTNENSNGGTMINKIMETLTLGLILVIVSIPEGLPMVITISLAFSVDRMLNKDNVLIKDIAAPETLGEVTEIICGKTGTLTTEDMEVKNFYAQEKEYINSRKTTLLNCHLDEKVIEVIQQSIVFNATCHIEMTDDSLYQPEGNGTDVSLFKWLQGADIPVHDIIQQKYQRFGDANSTKRLCAEWPFDTKRKYATTVMMLGENATSQRVFVKGSPDKILPMCTRHFHAGGNGQANDMSEHDKNNVLNHVKEMGKKGLRAIAFAYKDVDQAVESRSDADCDLTFALAVFLEDPLREKIPEIIQFIKYGKSTEQIRLEREEDGAAQPLPHVNVRLVSGDSKETAMIKAQEAGILERPEQQQRNGLNQYPIELAEDAYEGKVMTADEFRAAIGGVLREEGDAEGEIQLRAQDMEKFRELMENLVVVA
jgi:magnesium-transporting ATPase (P-type)